MDVYAGYPIHEMGVAEAPCPECGKDSAWLPVLDFDDEEVTVACKRGRCQATVRRPMEYGERFDFITQIRVRIAR